MGELSGIRETSVFLLAENRLLREALHRLLRKREGVRVVGECSYSSSAIHLIKESRCEILLLGWASMTLSRSNLLVDVLQVVPDLKILLLDAEENEDAFLAAVRAGALGYLPKEVSTQEVVAAVRAAANGEAVCPPRLCLSLFRYIAGQARGIRPCRGPRGLGLTRRQQELVAFIAKGWSNKEIAGNLNLSEQTVKNHVHRILRQLSVENRYEAVEASRAGGLLV